MHMFRSLCIRTLPCLIATAQVWAQGSPDSTFSSSSDKLSWKRLNLQMSATYFRVVKEGTVDYDSCLLYAGRSLGVSRAPVLGEGNDDTALLAQSQWIDLRQPSLGISQLNKTTGKQRLNLLLLLGAYYAFQPQGHDRMDSVE